MKVRYVGGPQDGLEIDPWPAGKQPPATQPVKVWNGTGWDESGDYLLSTDLDADGWYVYTSVI